MRPVLIFITSVVFCSSLCATDFFTKEKEGWFYYEESLQEDDNKTKSVKEEQEFISKIPLHNLNLLSAKEFRETMDKVRDIAVMRPTQENMNAFKTMVKFSTDQSNKFTKNWKLAGMLDDRNDYTDIGTGGFSHNAMQKEKDAKAKAKYLTEEVVFVTFVKNDEGTLTQKQIMANMELKRNYGVDVRTLSLTDWPEMAKRLDIKDDVENFVFYKDTKKWQRIRRGITDADTLVKDFMFFEENKNAFKEEEKN